MTHGPITLKEANRFVGLEHRHNQPVRGHRWSLAAYIDGRIVGVIIVGRTIAAGLHDDRRAEVLRLATDGTRNACSFLYRRAKRVAQAMGYVSLITYTRADESGSSMRAIGACCVAEIEARSWATSNRKRVRVDRTEPTRRRRWELLAG